MGETGFNQFTRLRKQLVIAAEKFGIEENWSLVLKPTRSEDMHEQLKLAHKLVEVVNRPCRKICVTLLRYNVAKPESSYAQVRMFARKKEGETFQQVVYVIYKFDEVISLLDAMNSGYDKVITIKPICNVQ